MVTEIGVELLVFTGFAERTYSAPCKLFVCVGKVTLTKLELLVKVPERVQLSVTVTGQGVVWVTVKVKGSLVNEHPPLLHPVPKELSVNNPKVLVPVFEIDVDD